MGLTAMNDQTARLTLVTLRRTSQNLAEDVRRGLAAPQKWLPCRYFYDEAGSAIFEQICDLPEYYLTRAETEILGRHAGEIVARCPSPISLVELGCGNSSKTRFMIAECLRRQPALKFVGIDIAQECLETGARRLLAEHPMLEIVGLVGEFADGLEHLATRPGDPRLVLFLGSTIGNLDERELDEFLAMLRRLLRPVDRFLLGMDLLKDPAILTAAYDDAQGVTARFNLNLLARINRELAGDFDLTAFQHRAVFNTEHSRIEMHLVSARDQTVRIGEIGLSVPFRAGEMIHTENCYKHSQSAMAAVLARHGFCVEAVYSDTGRRFCDLLVAPCSS
jgi:dimethylhistidine N-methyltransferase